MKQVSEIPTENDEITGLAFHPKANFLLAGFRDCTVHLWTVPTINLLQTFYGHIDEVTGVGFSLDGKLVLSISLDATFRVWSPKEGEEKIRIEGYHYHQDAILSFWLVPNSQNVLTTSADGTVALASIETGNIFQKTEPLGSPINSLAISIE